MKQRIIDLFKLLGPGIIFASLCIGETHFALLTYAGALYGHALLWMVLMVHLFYYPLYEFGARYAVATGDTLIDGYTKTRGGRFLLWVFLALLFVTPPLILGSLVGLTGSVLYAAFPSLDFKIWCLIAFVVTLIIVLSGKYKVLEGINKILVLIIIMVAITAFLVSPPDPGDFLSGLSPSIPAVAGVMIVVVAILRVPTDPASSIFLSEWAQQKRGEWLAGEGESKTILLKALKKSVFDIRLGIILSCLVAVIFLSVGATVLKPRGIVPEGIEITLKLSEIYTETIGSWIFPVFILAIFAAFWGGYVSAMDGILRLFKNIIRRLFSPGEGTHKTISTVYILLVTLVGLMLATLIQRPMFMVLLALSLGLINYPLIFIMNTYCVTRQVDEAFRPGKISLLLVGGGFILGITGLVLLILVRVLKVIS